MSSILPYVLRNRSFMNPFELETEDEALLAGLLGPLMSGDSLPFISGHREGSIKQENDRFQVNLDVHHFAPDDITVKVVDGHVVIEAKHDEKRDNHGWVSRQFIRRCVLPESCDPETVRSRLSSDGVLVITALYHQPTADERIVPITLTGPIRTQSSANSVHVEDKKEVTH